MSLAFKQDRAIGVAESGDIDDAYPLSPLQQGMLFHTLSAPHSGVDVEQMVATIRAPIDRAAFRQSWERVIEQHEVLRTSFHWEGLDEPLQRVHKRGRLEFEEADWRSLTKQEQQARLTTHLERDRLHDFDLTKPSLMRVALFRIGESDFHFTWTFHHAILDGRSFVSVLNQVYRVHDALSRGETLHLEPSRPYRDYIAWLSQLNTSKGERFWRDTFTGVNLPTPLPPSCNKRTAEQHGPKHDEQQIRFSAGLTSSLKSLASQCGVTMYTLVQAAWALLLSRYSGEEEIVFGTIMAGRRSALEGAESIVGPLINTLPVRIDVRNQTPLKSWLKDIRSNFIALREYEHTPLPLIQQWSESAKGRSLFESILVFENHDLESIIQARWGNWKIRDFKLIEQTNYPISLSGWLGEELLLKIEYERQRFDEATISRMLGHIKTVLEATLTHSNKPIGSLPMLTAAERRQIVVEWNNTATTKPANIECVHRLFEAQAASAPNAVALIHEDVQLTYYELNEQANQLAHYLQSIGVKSETLVGISLDRSPAMIVALLATLKAGGAYVPLDPAYPMERLSAMVEDAGLSVLLTQQSLFQRLPQTAASVICLDSDRHIIARYSTENLATDITPENLAYVIYTSGSTGKPKGVLIEHRSLANYVETAIQEFGIEPRDCILQFASISFDTSAEEIYPCLARGATLVLRTDLMLNSTSTFLQCCRDWNVTVLDLPTAYWHELTASIESGDGLSLPSSIRLVIIGGERALPERVTAWHKLVPKSVRLLNTYGPTEATIVSTISDLSESMQPGEIIADVTVGRPIPNVRTYILDRSNQPVSIGVTGELHIAGAGVARGYLNDPALTAEKFVLNPFCDEPAAPMYKTGDLARYLPDGNIHLAGRVDDQVKINGFRIELGEVETALRSIEYVHDAVVLAMESGPGQKTLVAYFVPSKSCNPSARTDIREQLRSDLKKRLPRYMLPGLFVPLDALPISPNGKVDRKSLPKPESTDTTNANYARPRDPLERHMVEIWEEILSVHPVGIRDNFFDLGGHSLLTVRMMDRLERAFGKSLPLAVLFEEATIEHLAASLLKQQEVGSRPPVVEVQKGNGAKRPFFFLHGDFNGGGFYCLNLARGLGADQPFYAIQPHGLDGGPVPATIEAMAESQLRALRAFQPNGPYLLGGYCNGATIAFEMARQLQSQGETIDLLVLMCASANNVRFKLLDSIVNGLSKVKRLGPEVRVRRFLALRERLVRLEGIRDYYKSRIAEVSRMQRGQRIDFLRGKTRKAVANLGVALASALGNGSRAALQETQITTGLPEDRRQRISAAYTTALRGFVEKPYRGRVTVFWPDELALDNPNDPTSGWGRVASEVDLHRVAGGHITCITSNIHSLSETLKVCLQKTQAECAFGN
jgi:amino acid adenylation domain-containing protein